MYICIAINIIVINIIIVIIDINCASTPCPVVPCPYLCTSNPHLHLRPRYLVQ